MCRSPALSAIPRPWVHTLRHTWNNILRQNAPELVRQSLIGHADEEIGKRYSAVGLDEKRAAVAGVVRMVKG
jgi:integrase